MSYDEYYKKAFELNGPNYDHPVYQAVLGLLNSEWLVWVIWVLAIVVFVVFLAYCLSKEGRDERGRAIIGSACLYGTMVLFVLINILSQFSLTAMSSLAVFSNCLRLVFNGYFLTVLISIAVLRKRR